MRLNPMTHYVEIGNKKALAKRLFLMDPRRSRKVRRKIRALKQDVQRLGSRVKGEWRHHFLRNKNVEELARLHSEFWNALVQDSIALPGENDDF